jgi:hypothetical protein
MSGNSLLAFLRSETECLFGPSEETELLIIKWHMFIALYQHLVTYPVMNILFNSFWWQLTVSFFENCSFVLLDGMAGRNYNYNNSHVESDLCHS